MSLTSVVSKLMEKIVRKKINKHIKKNNLFSKNQFGFIDNRSTTLQLLKITDEWMESIEKNNPIDVVYLDFMKAFDTVSHKKLLHKLQNYEIHHNILAWIKHFLKDRRQKVIVNGQESDWRPVTSGIPQGSVLGPLLFVLFVNDMPKNLKSSIYLFADDTKIYREIRDPSDTEILQEDLIKLEQWSKKWQMKFNPKKCTAMRINNDQNYDLKYYLTSDNKSSI